MIYGPSLQTMRYTVSELHGKIMLTYLKRNSGNVTVRVSTLFSDFAAVDISHAFDFHTATDGWGPYHVSTTSNGVEYQFLEVDVVLPDEGTQAGGRLPAFFVDSLVLESTE